MSKEESDSFIRKHSSIIFIIGLVVAGSLLLPVGFLLQTHPNSWVISLGIVLNQMGGCLIGVALTAVFVNLPDLRGYLATMITTLFTEGDVVPLLSFKTKSKLRERLLLDSVKNRATTVEPTLLTHVRKVNETIFSVPYITNYHVQSTITRDANDKNVFVEYSVTSYRVHVHHLLPAHKTFQMRNFHETTFPVSLAKTANDWMRRFEVRIGNHTFSRNDAIFEESPFGSSRLIVVRLDKDIPLESDVDVTVISEVAGYSHDPVHMVIARFPCQGFHVNLSFEEGYNYDCGWFTHCPVLLNVPEKGQVDFLPNGISASTNEWVMPGEGVALYYFKTN